jgi:glycosyltransferase involved in cell wall biosynthesis
VSASSSLVSVVIPGYNCGPFIGAALDSVFRQSYRPIEVIVVDDGSSDSTADVIHSYREVHYLRQSNRGPSAARNTGIGAAEGTYVAFLDADDLWMPEKLAEQVALLEAQPDAVLAFANMRLVSQESGHEPSMFEKYNLNASFFGHEHLVVKAPAKLVWSNFIPTSTVIAKRQAVIDAGGFDEAFCKAEDWELWLRLALHAPIVYSRKLLMLKRVHDVNTSRDSEGMNVAALRVLEKFDRQHHALLLRLGVDITGALRDGYRNLGYFYLRQIALADARAAFWKSLSLGFQVRALIYFISTLLGRRFVASVVRARG